MVQLLNNNIINDDTEITFKDIVMLFALSFIFLFIIIIPFINEIKNNKTEDVKMQGNVTVELIWDNSLDVDLDLWVKAPNDVPVGFTNKNGLFFNLLRDDLGNRHDFSYINQEISFCRGLDVGEYVINVHVYRAEPRDLPLKYMVILRVKENAESDLKTFIFEGMVSMKGEEVTVHRFKITKNNKNQLIYDNSYENRNHFPLAKKAIRGYT